MAAAFDPTHATAEERAAIIEHGATWRARMRSTERTDKAAAEAAITDLYQRARLRPPAFEWRGSPITAANGAMLADGGRRGTWFRGIEQSLRVDARWVRSTLARLGDTPDYEHFRRASHQPFRRLLALDAASDGIGRPLDALVRQPLFTPTPVDRARTPDPRDVEAAGRVAFGDEWPLLCSLLGEHEAGRVIGDAIRIHAQALARSRVGLVPETLGQLDTLHPYVVAARDVLGLRLSTSHMAHVDAFLAVASSAGPWFALRNVVYISERPLVCTVDPEGRVHGTDAPALAYADGVRLWAWHGVQVPEVAILDPGSIPTAWLYGEANAEVRRVLVERYGYERFIREGATAFHRDETGTLWRRWITEPRRWGGGGELLQMVEVLNSTPEPDGSRKTYFLRVPPTIGTAREAVAWTFGLSPEEYRPSLET